MYLNHVFLIGNLTRDPEAKALPSGISVTSFSLATNRVWKDKNGQRQESADYHNIVVFGRQAETAAQYLKKGAMIMVEGRLQTRTWEADGKKNYRTEIIADRFQFGPKVEGGSSRGSESNFSSTPKQDDGQFTQDFEYPESDISPEDIPF
jgi:single-strand DNA-binding protein